MSGVAQQAAGFDGEVSGMSLVDLLQMKAMGRFSGRVVVEQNGVVGYLFFRDGELIHAELGSFEGKEAFARVLSWGGGTFRAEPKVATTRQSITEGFQFLLLDALRMQDELAAGIDKTATGAGQAESSPAAKGGGMKERLSGIAGIQEVALTDRAGAVVQAIGANAEALAAQGMYLVTTSGQVGQELGLGNFKGAVVQGEAGHLIAFEGTKNYLFIGVDGESKPATVEAEVRRVLSQQG